MEQKILSLKDDKINSEVELIEYPVELIGGRNLITGTYSDWRVMTMPAAYGLYTPFLTILDDWRGKRVTHAFEVKDVPAGEAVRIRIDFHTNASDYVIHTHGNVVYIEGKSHVSYTIPADTQYTMIRIRVSPVSFTSPYNFLFRCEKLEFGTIPTDWTPAPEDLNLSYPDFITEFKPSVSDRYILTEELIEYPEELIGGRNYVRRGVKPSESSGIVTTTLPEVHGFKIVKAEGTNSNSRLYNVITSNGNWTVSFYVTANVDASFRIDICDRNSTSFNLIKDQKRRIELTAYNDRYGTVYHFVDFVVHTHGEYVIEYVKTEKGNKATDWTPAPEDLGLTYPDHIQSFGTSFSNNILINEFIEQ